MTEAARSVAEAILVTVLMFAFYGPIVYGLYRYARSADASLFSGPGPLESARDQMPTVVPEALRSTVSFVDDPRYDGETLTWEERGYSLRIVHQVRGDGEGGSSAVRAMLLTEWTGRAMSKTQLDQIAAVTPRPRAVRGWEFGPTECVVRIRPAWRRGRAARAAADWLLSVLDTAEAERRQDIPD